MGRPSIKIIDNTINRIKERTEENYLRSICESIVKYNFRARTDIFDILNEKFLSIDEATKVEEDQLLRRALLAEMYVLMIQEAEDLALLFLMSMKPTVSESLKFYLNNRNIEFTTFFGECIRGLSKTKLLKIYHIQPAGELLTKGLIKVEEMNDFEKFIDIRVKELRDYLKTIGKAYTSIKFDKVQGKMIPVKMGTVQVYNNLKHAYKVVMSTKTGDKLYTFDSDNKSLDVIEKMITLEEAFNRINKQLPKSLKPYSQTPQITTGGFRVKNSTAKIFADRIKPFSNGIRDLAKIILEYLDNPELQVQNFRFDIFRIINNNPEPKGYESCPCGKLNPVSGNPVKYKNCHRKTVPNY